MPDGGAAARRCQNKVFFTPTLSAKTGIQIVTKSNLTFTAYPIGVFFHDQTTGKRTLLAPFQNGVKGQFVPPNTYVYPSAFHSALMDADLRIIVTKGAIAWDTIVTRALPATVTPRSYFMDPSTTLLQVQHAWATPFPPTLGETSVPGISDTSIDFGDLQFGSGRVFDWDGAAKRDDTTPAKISVAAVSDQPPVAKAWQNGNPSILSESVLWTNVQGKSAFVIDPPIVVAGNGSYTFDTYSHASGNTYWLQASANFGGTNTFQPGCIIKRAPGTTLTASGGTSGMLVCKAQLRTRQS
jgi:hypothetical protein